MIGRTDDRLQAALRRRLSVLFASTFPFPEPPLNLRHRAPADAETRGLPAKRVRKTSANWMLWLVSPPCLVISLCRQEELDRPGKTIIRPSVCRSRDIRNSTRRSGNRRSVTRLPQRLEGHHKCLRRLEVPGTTVGGGMGAGVSSSNDLVGAVCSLSVGKGVEILANKPLSWRPPPE